MKSMLHEGSTVLKAIEKAWVDSGKPAEFKINVLEAGQTGFLGFSKHPAIVSITYDQKKVAQHQRPEQRGRQTSNPAPKKVQGQGREQDTRRASQPQHNNRDNRKKQQLQPQQRILQPKASSLPQGDQPKREQPIHTGWHQDLVDDVTAWCRDFVRHLGTNVAFTTKIEKNVLRITFERSACPKPDEEKSLYGGMSYLLIQFLKKKHRKKFAGYHIVLGTKSSHDQRK
ncbi:MAG: Jag N-terminal domain-containing protein [Epsilonproteobacteria bacterium]|nr:Jag N-terminal domain-containing protein [Campylobacterota bacterium]